MKKSTKLISILLAIVMVFSASSISVLAAIPSGAQNRVEDVISNSNLAELADWLLTNLNNAKGNIIGTVLKLVFMLVKQDDLQAQIGDKNVNNLSDDEAASILLKWTDKLLADNTKSLTENDTYKAVVSAIRVATFGAAKIDLSNTKNALATVYSLGNMKAVLLLLGDAKDLNVSALKDVKSKSDLNAVFAVLQFLKDNTKLIKKAVNGNIDLGIDALNNAIKDPMNSMKNLPLFLKSYLYKLIDSDAEAGKFDKDAAAASGDWGASPYASYSADQMLAAALIKLINDTDDVVSKEDADAALATSFYGLLTKYGPTLYNRFAIDFLNGTLKDLIGKLKDYPEAAKAFNLSYTFDENSFKAAFADAGSTGFLGQFNNIVCIILEKILSADAYKAIAPVAGDNSKLNDNLASACRYVLPILATYSKDLGFDFTKFTADAVKDMDLPEMAVAVLKIFFPTWFKSAYAAEPGLIDNANTIAQLGAATMKYVVMNQDLLNWFTNGFDVTDITAKITADKIASLTDAECVDLAAEIGARLGAYALDEQKSITNFTLANKKDDWTWRDYCDEIVDWAINFVKGFPAVAVNHITAKMGEYDGYGPFYKINVVLNELIDFALLSNVGDETFKLDIETLLFDTILNNAFNFDVAAILKVFEVNSNEGNVLAGPVIKGVINIVDRLLSALFVHTCGEQKDFEKKVSDTLLLKGKYDAKNGHYIAGTVTEETLTPEPAVPANLGDVSGDGEIKSEDARLALRASVKLEKDITEGTDAYKAADVNGDGAVKSDDARTILRVSVKLEDIETVKANYGK